MAKDIRVALQLDNRQYNNAIKQSKQQTKKFTDDTKTGISGLKTAFAGLFAAIGTREIISLGDEFSNLRNRLVAVTGSQQDAATALQLVNQVAADSRSDISSVASLFADLTVATKDLGTSQAEIADVTRVFSQTLQISGADAGAAAGAIRQFGQALASGVLRGDEFNSIAETNSFFMLQFADSLGVPIGALRDLAKEGKLTAELVLQATRDMKDRVEEDFSNTTTTVSQAFTSLRNSVVNLFGQIEGETGVFEGLAGAIQDLANKIANVDVQGFIEKLDELIYVMTLLIFTFGTTGIISVITKFQGGMIALGTTVGGLATRFFSFSSITKNLGESMRGFSKIIDGTAKGGRIGALGTGIAGLGRAFVRFLGPVGLVISGLELLSFASKKLGGPDFMAGPRDAVIGFGKDLLGFNEETENAISTLQRFDKVSKDFVGPLLPGMSFIEDDDGGGGNGGSVIDERLKNFKDGLEKLKVTGKNYQEQMDKLNATFGKETVEDLRLYNQALSALNSAFPEQADTVRELAREQERLAEKRKEDAEELAKAQLAIQNFTKSLDDQLVLTIDLEEKQRELNALLQKYPELAELLADAQDKINKAFSDNEALNSFLDTLGQAQKTLSEDLAEALLEGKNAGEAFKDFFKTLVTQLIADAIRLSVIQPILGAIFGVKFGAGGGVDSLTGGGLLGFLGFAANGGPIMKNRPYIVGERGPELMIPGQSGTMIPNNMLGGGTTNINYTINAVDTDSFRNLVAKDPEFIYSVTRAGARRLPGR